MAETLNADELKNTAEAVKAWPSEETDTSEAQAAHYLENLAQKIDSTEMSEAQAAKLYGKIRYLLMGFADGVEDETFKVYANTLQTEVDQFLVAADIQPIPALAAASTEITEDKIDGSEIKDSGSENETEVSEEEKPPPTEEEKARSIEKARETLYEKLGADKAGGRWERFTAGLADGVLEGAEFVKKLITNPVGTIKEIVAGLWEAVKSPVKTIRAIGASIWEALSNIYETGKMAAEVVIGLIGGAGAMVAKKVVKNVVKNAKKGKPKASDTPEGEKPEISDSIIEESSSNTPEVERQKESPDVSGKESRMDVPSPKISEVGDEVMIPRSNGSMSKAQIAEVLPDGRLRVTWEQNGQIATKTIDSQKVKPVRPLDAPAPEMRKSSIPEVKRNKPLTPSNLGQSLANTNSLPELGQIFKQMDESGVTVQGSNRSYTGHELYQITKAVQDGTQPITALPRVNGIRAKAREFINQPAKQVKPEAPTRKVVPLNPNQSTLKPSTRPNHLTPKIQQPPTFKASPSPNNVVPFVQHPPTFKPDVPNASNVAPLKPSKVPDLLHGQMIQKLWPDGLNSHLSQGKIGNCYFVAALRTIKAHPDAQQMLTRMVTPEANGSVTVRFPGDKHNRPINITGDQLSEMNNIGVKGSLGDRILERAYARLIRGDKDGQVSGEYSGKTVLQMPGQKMEFEGGHANVAIKDIMGPFFRKKDIKPKDMVQALDAINPKNKNRIALTLSSRRPTVLDGKRADSRTYSVTDANGDKLDLNYKHAYGVEDVDINNRRILIVNPHNTATERTWITFEQAQDYFSMMKAGELDIDSLMEAMPGAQTAQRRAA